MQKGRSIIITGTVLTILSLAAFTAFRTRTMEREYLSNLSPVSRNISRELGRFEQGTDIKSRNLQKFADTALGRNPGLAIIAVSDASSRLLIAVKNDLHVRSVETYDAIIQGFTRNEFQVPAGSEYLVRYYQQKKHFLFIIKSDTSSLLLVYPYRFGVRLLLRLALEAMLILLLGIIFTTARYVRMQRSVRQPAGEKYRVVDLMPKKSAPQKDTTPVRRISRETEDTLHNYVFDFFSYIAAHYAPETISLYVMNTDSTRLEKLYELKGEAFIKIDASGFDSIDINTPAGNELKKSSVMVVDRGSRITIPVLYRSALMATINLTRADGFRGPEISDIRLNADRIAKALSEYLLLNDVVVDPATGMYSKAYFQMKYDEIVKLHDNRGGDFGLVIISPLDPSMRLKDEHRGRLLKSIYPAIAETAPVSAIICRFDDAIALLLPDAQRQEAESLAARTCDSLRKTRVQVDKKIYIELNPAAGVSSAASAGPGYGPLEESMRDLGLNKLRGRR